MARHLDAQTSDIDAYYRSSDRGVDIPSVPWCCPIARLRSTALRRTSSGRSVGAAGAGTAQRNPQLGYLESVGQPHKVSLPVWRGTAESRACSFRPDA